MIKLIFHCQFLYCLYNILLSVFYCFFFFWRGILSGTLYSGVCFSGSHGTICTARDWSRDSYEQSKCFPCTNSLASTCLLKQSKWSVSYYLEDRGSAFSKQFLSLRDYWQLTANWADGSVQELKMTPYLSARDYRAPWFCR